MFHVVHIRFHGKHRYYEIWKDNKKNVNWKLNRHQAYSIVKTLNGE